MPTWPGAQPVRGAHRSSLIFRRGPKGRGEKLFRGTYMPQLQALKPLGSSEFTDTLDGYFPLYLSVQQMMTRRRIGLALFTLKQAPFLEVPQLSDAEPVPFSLRSHRSGFIDNLTCLAMWLDGNFRLSGAGVWRHEQERQPGGPLDGRIRLGEPAFIKCLGATDVDPARQDEPAVLALASFAGGRVDDNALGEAAQTLAWKVIRAHTLKGSTKTGARVMTEFVSNGSERQVAGVDRSLQEWSHLLYSAPVGS